MTNSQCTEFNSWQNLQPRRRLRRQVKGSPISFTFRAWRTWVSELPSHSGKGGLELHVIDALPRLVRHRGCARAHPKQQRPSCGTKPGVAKELWSHGAGSDDLVKQVYTWIHKRMQAQEKQRKWRRDSNPEWCRPDAARKTAWHTLWQPGLHPTDSAAWAWGAVNTNLGKKIWGQCRSADDGRHCGFSWGTGSVRRVFILFTERLISF